MANPARQLNDDEEVVVDARPHVCALVAPLLVAAAAIAVAAAATVLDVPTAAAWALVALVAVALLNLIRRWMVWRSTSLIVTNERLIRRTGVLRRSGREIPLGALSDISYRQSIFGRMIGAGDVLLQSAGRDSTEVFPSLPHPAAIQNAVYQAISARSSGGGAGGRGLSLPEQLEKLDDLRRRGVLTEAEFEATKSRLLRQP